MDSLSFDIGFLVSRIQRLSSRVLDARLKPAGIATASIPVLALLKSQEAMTQKDLSDRIGTEQPTMAQLLNRMERDDLIKRIPNPADGRSTHIVLTTRAKRLLPKAREILEKNEQLAQSGLSASDLVTLRRLLELYLANVERQLRQEI